MSEDATLDDFAEKQEENINETIEAVPESSVDSSLDETSVGKIPDDWIATRLGDIVEEAEYGLTESAEEYDPDKPRYIRTQDFDDYGGLQVNSRASLSREKAKDGLLGEGDLLFARSGSIGASLGKTYLYDTNDGDCCFGGYSIRHRLQDSGLNHKYISEYTLSEQYWDWIRRRAKTTAQSNINTGEYASLLLPIPPLPEQRKIATVLNTVDRAIEKTEEIIRQSERVREGVTQNIFTTGYYNHSEYSDVRLGPVKTSTPKDWSIKSIPDYFEIIDGDRGKNYPSGSDFSEQGYCLFLSATNVTDEGLKFDETEFITQEKDEKLRKGKLKRGDIIMTTRGTVGNFGLYDESVEYDNVRINSGMVILRPKENISSVEYYYHFFRSGIFQRQINATSYGTAQPQTSVTDIKKMGVLEPGTDEKRQISEIIEDAVSEIQIQKEYRNQLQLIKRGLLQDLLSGTVRTTDTNIEVPEEIAQYG
jgi:type I restriction enzyme S subunit